MKRTRLIIAALALTSLLPFAGSTHAAAPVAAPAGLKTSGTLTIGTNFGYPPMEEFTGANADVPSGADIDLGRALASEMGLKANFLNITDFGTIIIGLQGHKFDIIMSSMNVTAAARSKTGELRALLPGWAEHRGGQGQSQAHHYPGRSLRTGRGDRGRDHRG